MSAEDVIGDALFCEPGPQDPNGFGGGSGGMVIARNIDLFATCRACLLPFKICCHIAYIPAGGRVVGLSKLPRVAEIYSSRLQTPHEFADGVAQALSDSIKPLGVAVVVESWHLQWPAVTSGNGITKAGFEDEAAWIPSRAYASKGCYIDRSKASVEDKAAWIPCQAFAGKGSFADKSSALWDELIAVLQFQGIQIHFSALMESLGDVRRIGSCPFLSSDFKTSWNFPLLPARCNGLPGFRFPTNGGIKKAPEELSKAENSYDRSVAFVPAMITAVDSLLRAVGQDPNSQELEYTSMRYVLWLLASTQGSRNPSSNLFQKYKNGNGTAANGFVHSPVVDFVDQLDMEIACEFSIPFCSQCEHHLLPFSGIAHVGYFHSKRSPPIERTMVLKIVQLYSRRLQVQERLTKQVAETLLPSCSLGGVMVVVEASHLCMVLRGVKQIASTTATVATFGRFTKDVASRATFLQKILKAKVDMSGQC
ncbi:hypothetical protein O6H91_04G137700 [Diphasiastrum complanatum]|nr:hypothetical protein O6H91_04G137700 [Diphasiastrum complanatum]